MGTRPHQFAAPAPPPRISGLRAGSSPGAGSCGTARRELRGVGLQPALAPCRLGEGAGYGRRFRLLSSHARTCESLQIGQTPQGTDHGKPSRPATLPAQPSQPCMRRLAHAPAAPPPEGHASRLCCLCVALRRAMRWAPARMGGDLGGLSGPQQVGRHDTSASKLASVRRTREQGAGSWSVTRTSAQEALPPALAAGAAAAMGSARCPPPTSCSPRKKAVE